MGKGKSKTKQVHFKDLSFPLKAGIIGGIGYLAAEALIFLIAFWIQSGI